MEGMIQRTLRIPGTLKHTNDEQTDVALQEKAREYATRHPGLYFLADVLRSLHGPIAPRRNAKTFISAFPPREVMEALVQRPDLRVKVVKAITGSPAALLRRLSAEALASQVDLLAIEDLPEAERAVRAEGDRALSVPELYFKYLDPLDFATYMPARSIWGYEAQDDWLEATAGARALMAAELRSVRRHGILTDTEILNLLGDETLERHLPLPVRTAMRKAARRAAAEGRPFTDTDMFAGAGAVAGARDLIDDMVDNVPLAQLREVIVHVASVLGLSDREAGASAAAAATPAPTIAAVADNNATGVPTPVGLRVGPKGVPPVKGGPQPAAGKGPPAAPTDRRGGPPPRPGSNAAAKVDLVVASIVDADGPPEPDDDLALVEEVSGRI
jgi:hypothetical protein